MSFGQKLKEAREIKGYSLEYIEEETKIRKLYLNALEQENFKILPPKVYATGFVRKYADFLGLDPDIMVEEFQVLAYSDEVHNEESESQKIKRNFHFPLRNILAAIVFLLIAIWAGNWVVGYITKAIPDESDKKSPPTQVEEPANIPEPNNEQDIQEEPKGTLLVEANQDCWLHIVVDGEAVYSQTMRAGESANFEGKQSIYIKAGNAGGIVITFNGEKQEPIGGIGEVVEKEFIIEASQE